MSRRIGYVTALEDSLRLRNFNDSFDAYVASCTSEVQRWIAWMTITSAGYPSASVIDIANTLSLQMAAASYSSKILVLYPLLGDKILQAIIPLRDNIGAGIPDNIGPFVDSDCGTAVGLKGKSLTMLNTGLMPQSVVPSNQNAGLGVSIRNYDATGNTTEIIGCNTVSIATIDGRFLIDSRTSGADCFFSWGRVGSRTTSTHVGVAEHLYGQRSANNLRSLWSNGAAIGTNDTSTDGEPTLQRACTPICLAGMIDAGGTSALGTKHTYGFFYITDGSMSSGDISAFHTLLNTYLITPTGR